MKKNKDNNKNYIIGLVLLIICVVVAIFILRNRCMKNEQAKNNALVLSNMAVRKYIEDREYSNDDNIAIKYELKDLDILENDLKCPLNNMEYDKESSVTVHFDQNKNELDVQTYLKCGNHIIDYSCNAQNDIYKSNCTLEID